MRKPADNADALAAFIVRKAEIDTILARLTALGAEHFNCMPNALTWGDIADFSRYRDWLRPVSDAAFPEDEYAR